MKLVFSIEIDKKGLHCSGDVNGNDAYKDIEANVLAIGALEIAKASLLAHRWGMNIGNLKRPSLIKDEKTRDKEKKK